MEPISTIIVTALAAGAAAGLTDTASQFVKEAYAGLKGLIKRKYAKAGASVDVLETDPSSEDLQSFAGKQLATSGAADDQDVQKLAQALLDAVAQYAPESARTIGVELKDIRAGSMRLGDINVQAAGSATALSASNITVAGDFVIEGVTVSSGLPASLPAQPAPVAAAPKIKILFLAANPSDTTRLRLDEEVRAIDKALQAARYRDAFDLNQAHAVRVDDVQGLLLRYQPHIVHFSGHGSSSGQIIFQDDAGRAYAVPPQALANVFVILRDNIRCMVLNACFSLPQAEVLAQHIDCVVGMSAEIGDVQARAFAASFYEALAYGRNVKTAFELGRNRVDLSGLKDADVPQLLAPNGDPAAVTFVR